MITHKEAIEKLEELDIVLSDTERKMFNVSDIIDLLKNEMWHKYPDEVPKENKSYLIKYDDGEYKVLEYINDNWKLLNECYKNKIIAWRELPKYDNEVKE